MGVSKAQWLLGPGLGAESPRLQRAGPLLPSEHLGSLCRVLAVGSGDGLHGGDSLRGVLVCEAGEGRRRARALLCSVAVGQAVGFALSLAHRMPRDRGHRWLSLLLLSSLFLLPGRGLRTATSCPAFYQDSPGFKARSPTSQEIPCPG